MANPEHLAQIRLGAKSWNAWRSSQALREVDLADAELDFIRLPGVNLGKADLSGVQMNNADLSGSNLKGANFDRAVIGNTDFSGARMIGASLDRADALGSNFTQANLDHSWLGNAHLACADFVGASIVRADIKQSSLAYSDFTGADLTGSDLTECVLVNANLTNACLNGCRVFGASIWRTNLTNTTQNDLIVTAQDEPTITVDNIEVAQFLYLLIDNSRLRGVIDTLTAKSVLILGRFTAARKAVLEKIHQELRNHNYLPILFDFSRAANRDLTETVLTLAGLSRFVIADLTDLAGREWRPGSVQQEITVIRRTWESVPIQPIIERGQSKWSMFPDLTRSGHILPTYEYASQTQLLLDLRERVIAPAEAAANELNEKLRSLYERDSGVG